MLRLQRRRVAIVHAAAAARRWRAAIVVVVVAGRAVHRAELLLVHVVISRRLRAPLAGGAHAAVTRGVSGATVPTRNRMRFDAAQASDKRGPGGAHAALAM